MGDSRILVGTPATLTATFYDGGETAVDPGTVTVTVTRADGTVVVTDAATTGSGAAARSYTLPAQTRLDHLTATWEGGLAGRVVTTHHDVVGGFYAELAEIRVLDALSNTTRYPTEKLAAARVQAEDRFDLATGVAWVPRHERETLSGNATPRLALRWARPRSVIAATIDGAAVTDLLTLRLYNWGVVERTAGNIFPVEAAGGGGNVVVEYTHGYDRPPADLKQAFLTYVRYLLLDTTSRIPDRASTMSTDFGTFQLVTAGFQRPTGLPEVDAVLLDHSHRVPGMAVVGT
jgi:hypothetical protein